MNKIKITKGSGWYYNEVGNEFEYVIEQAGKYVQHLFWIDEPEINARCVLAEHCVKVEDKSCHTCYYNNLQDECDIDEDCLNQNYKFWHAKHKEEEKKMESKCKECKYSYSCAIESCDHCKLFVPKKEYITKDRYEGLDPEIADLLKQGKWIKGYFWNDNPLNKDEGYLAGYNPITLKKYGCQPVGGEPDLYINFTPILKETEEEIDWNKVPVDTKILVSDSNLRPWIKTHFAKYINDEVRAWDKGATSFTTNMTSSWKYAKLYKEGEEK